MQEYVYLEFIRTIFGSQTSNIEITIFHCKFKIIETCMSRVNRLVHYFQFIFAFLTLFFHLTFSKQVSFISTSKNAQITFFLNPPSRIFLSSKNTFFSHIYLFFLSFFPPPPFVYFYTSSIIF